MSNLAAFDGNIELVLLIANLKNENLLFMHLICQIYARISKEDESAYDLLEERNPNGINN